MRPTLREAQFKAALEILDPTDEERERIEKRAKEIRRQT